MDFLQKIILTSPSGETISFDNAYIYDDNSVVQRQGVFACEGKHTAIIPASKCEVHTGMTAQYNDVTRVVTAVCDNTERSKLMPHLRLTLE